jgi:hypothetical protein
LPSPEATTIVVVPEFNGKVAIVLRKKFTTGSSGIIVLV